MTYLEFDGSSEYKEREYGWTSCRVLRFYQMKRPANRTSSNAVPRLL
jgi:hypothetical protein